jgi:DNA-binding NarL/FixJ family response regulator
MVLALMTQGLSNAEIAARLSLSDKTVRNHVSHVFDKLRRPEPRAGDRLRTRAPVSNR